jgi:hypothetical protein
VVEGETCGDLAGLSASGGPLAWGEGLGPGVEVGKGLGVGVGVTLCVEPAGEDFCVALARRVRCVFVTAPAGILAENANDSSTKYATLDVRDLFVICLG